MGAARVVLNVEACMSPLDQEPRRWRGMPAGARNAMNSADGLLILRLQTLGL